MTVTVTLISGSASDVFVCYADNDVSSSFTSPSQCAGNFDSSIFAGEAPPGGIVLSGNPATFTETMVASSSPTGQQVPAGDWLFFHVNCSGSCPNGDATVLGGGYSADPPALLPNGPEAGGLIAAVLLLCVAFVVVSRRRASADRPEAAPSGLARTDRP